MPKKNGILSEAKNKKSDEFYTQYEDILQMLGADLQVHKVIYNNNPILKWCLTNTGVQTDRKYRSHKEPIAETAH